MQYSAKFFKQYHMLNQTTVIFLWGVWMFLVSLSQKEYGNDAQNLIKTLVCSRDDDELETGNYSFSLFDELNL